MWNIFKTKTIEYRSFSPQIEKRVAKIPGPELEVWADQAISEIGRCLSMYQRNRDQRYLDEFLKGAEALHAVANSMHKKFTKIL
jgi:hypothetical protein